jgi:hypothetical protein
MATANFQTLEGVRAQTIVTTTHMARDKVVRPMPDEILAHSQLQCEDIPSMNIRVSDDAHDIQGVQTIPSEGG